jgi:hypothetical protein
MFRQQRAAAGYSPPSLPLVIPAVASHQKLPVQKSAKRPIQNDETMGGAST